MSGFPRGARPMSDTEIGDGWVDSASMWKRCCVLIFSLGLICTLITWIIGDVTVWIAYILCIILLIINTINEVSKKRNLLEKIALGEGHPWHDFEGRGKTNVYLMDADESWVKLNPQVRIIVTEDPILSRWMMRKEDVEGDIVVRWNQKPSDHFISLINMAQALAEAQNRGFEEEDPIEQARIREEDEESLLEREWEGTESGSIEYQPGALLRSFKKKDGDK